MQFHDEDIYVQTVIFANHVAATQATYKVRYNSTVGLRLSLPCKILSNLLLSLPNLSR